MGPGAPYLGHRRHSEHLNSRRERKLSIFHHSPCFWENISIFTLCWRFHFFLQMYLHDCMFIMQIETDSCIYMYFQVLGKNSSTWYMFYDMCQCSSTISMLLDLKLFVQILICRILHVGVICGIDSMSPIVLQDTLVLTAIMLGVSVSNFKGYFGKQSVGGWRRLWNDNCDINTCWNTHAT